MVAAAVVHRRILSRFPGPFQFCFAYGSGVKQQLGYADLQPAAAPVAAGKRPMIDLMLCVDDALAFHRTNLVRNPDDYSSLARCLGVDSVCALQASRALGAGVYCNTLVPLNDGRTLIKYGVISTGDLLADLRDWRHLYVAGRLHKPVEVLHGPRSDDVRRAQHDNRRSAVRVALLRLPETFGYYELFYAIANLSYAGDFRMYFGEKRDKVRNIVGPQLAAFRALYAGVLDELQRDDVLRLAADDDAGEDALRRVRLVQNRSADATLAHLRALPKTLRESLAADVRRTTGDVDDEATLRRLIAEHPLELRRLLDVGTERIVWNSSVGQSLKNIPTAGLGKAVRYSWQKVLKTFNM